MSVKQNVEVSMKAFHAWKTHDVEALLSLVDENHVVESDTIPAPMYGHEGLRQFMQTYLAAFPDIDFQLEQTIAEGDFVVQRWTATGTHRGELMGIAPTGRRIRWDHVSIVRVKDGRVVGQWAQPDLFGIYRQLTAP